VHLQFFSVLEFFNRVWFYFILKANIILVQFLNALQVFSLEFLLTCDYGHVDVWPFLLKPCKQACKR